MHTVFDVAKFYLSKGPMSPKKLQKMVYYAYGWTLALLNDTIDDLHYRLFSNQIEAWVHGPVIPDLYHRYKEYGWKDIPKLDKYDGPTFSPDAEDILNQVWDVYGRLNANQLEMLSHRETPWRNARNGIAAYAVTTNPISDEDIFVFFNEQVSS